MSLPANHFYEFGPFRIDPGERVLFRDGRPVALPPKTFDTLIALVERSGHIVEKDELMKRVWPDTFVEEVNLARHVSNLRKALGDDGEDYLYIETVARRGYRFLAKVRTVPIEAVEIDEDEELVVETHSLSHIVTKEEEVVEAEAIRIGGKPVAALGEGSVTRAPSRVEWVKRHKLGAAFALAAMVVAIGAGLYYWLNRNVAERATAAFKSVPLTSFPGVESEPAFSPDGSRIAFVWNSEKEDNFDIYVQLINAGPPLRLTSDPGRDIAPAWTPDGSHIAFTRIHGIAGGERTIFLIPAMGGTERKLLSINTASESWLAARLSWSPDGKLLAFSGKESPQSMASIFLLAVETLEQRQLTPPPLAGYSDTNPAFSPDGKTLAFIRRHGTSSREIYLAPAAGGEPRRLTNDNRTIDSVAWTADGRGLVFTSDRSGLSSLWRISASGGAPERFAVGGENVHDAALSRQGDRLAYSQELADTNIWRWEAPESAGRRRPPIKLIASTRIDTNPQYSPDGRKIAFVSDRSGGMEVWVCDSDGSNLVRLTHFNGPFVGSPRWSPDSRQIAFDCVAGNPRDIYLVSAEGGLARRFTTGASEEVRPSWSRDGKWIYFGSNRGGDWQLWKAPAGGGAAAQVTRQGGSEAFESPDGKFVYYSIGSLRPGVWRVPVEGGEEVRVIERAAQGAWAVSDRGIYFLTPKANRKAMVEFYDFATRQITQLGEIEKEMNTLGPNFSVSPDARWILCSRMDQSGSDVMLVENFR